MLSFKTLEGEDAAQHQLSLAALMSSAENVKNDGAVVCGAFKHKRALKLTLQVVLKKISESQVSASPVTDMED